MSISHHYNYNQMGDLQEKLVLLHYRATHVSSQNGKLEEIWQELDIELGTE